ncbi:hypothetical protein [Fulvivirga kasyanovii]|nr:hypothetical protein [Fulvivirga kasyanovii]
MDKWLQASKKHWSPAIKTPQLSEDNPHKSLIAELYDRYNGVERNYVHEPQEAQILLYEGDWKTKALYHEQHFFSNLQGEVKRDLAQIYESIKAGEISAVESLNITWKPHEGSPKEAIQKNVGYMNDRANFLVYAILLQEIQQLPVNITKEKTPSMIASMKYEIHTKVLKALFPQYESQIKSGYHSQFVALAKDRFLEYIYRLSFPV